MDSNRGPAPFGWIGGREVYLENANGNNLNGYVDPHAVIGENGVTAESSGALSEYVPVAGVMGKTDDAGRPINDDGSLKTPPTSQPAAGVTYEAASHDTSGALPPQDAPVTSAPAAPTDTAGTIAANPSSVLPQTIPSSAAVAAGFTTPPANGAPIEEKSGWFVREIEKIPGVEHLVEFFKAHLHHAA